MLPERKVFNIGSCPFCGSGKIRVSHTMRPNRRLRCLVCGRHWKTVEFIESETWLPALLESYLSQGRFAHLDPGLREKILSIIRH